MSEKIILASDENETREILLFTDPSRLEARLAVKFAESPQPVKPDEIWSLLKQAKVSVSDEERGPIDGFLTAYEARPQPLQDHLLYSARPPVRGGDAPVNWKIDIGGEDGKPSQADEEEKEQDRIDYYQVTRFINVKEGDTLLVLGDPTPGKEGADIHGKPIPWEPGDPLPIKAGEHTKYLEDQHTLVSTSDGAVQIRNNKVSVEPVYEVNGDVDFSIGNVDFNGTVRIRGSVLDGFKVRASRDVFIGGNIESAEVDSDANIQIGGGVTARGKGHVHAGGSIRAKYINGASVRAGGDLSVTTEIVNSEVQCGGKVIVERGGIIGGTASALAGVVTSTLGSKMNVKTRIIAGVDRTRSERMKKNDEAIKEIDELIQKVDDAVGPFVKNTALIQNLPAEKRDALRKLVAKLTRLKEQKAALLEEREALDREVVKRKLPYVSAGKCIFSGVDVQIGTFCRTRYTDELEGPVRLRADLEKGQIVVFRT